MMRLFLVATLAVGARFLSNGQIVVDPVTEAVRPDLSDYPIYEDFFDRPELYRRALVHVVGLKGYKELGFSWKINSAEAYAVVETYGNDTGSADYFPIGSHTFGTVDAADNIDGFLFEWDPAKQLLIYKTGGTDGIKFTVFEDDTFGDDTILLVHVPVEDLPAPGAGYKEFTLQSEVESECAETEGADLVVRIAISELSIPFISESRLLDITHSFDEDAYPGIVYDETVLELIETGAATHEFQDGIDKAVVQSWRHKNSSIVEGALLWIIGYSDLFMHPHVLEQLFLGPNSAHKLDVYVLQWRLNGFAMHRGFLTDAAFNSHNAYGDFDVYNEEVKKTLALMRPIGTPDPYSRVIGYGHSTGGTILSNYLRTYSNDLDAILLHSPFLDWSDTSVNDFSLRTVADVLKAVRIWGNQRFVSKYSIPEEMADNPIEYLNRDIVISTWESRLYANYPWPWSWRKLYGSFVTVGFADGASDVFPKLKKAAPLVSEDLPVLVLASYGDDTLDADDIIKRSKWISDAREIVVLEHNGHDVFLSPDPDDNQKAIDAVRKWMDRILAAKSDDIVAGVNAESTSGDLVGFGGFWIVSTLVSVVASALVEVW